MLFSNQKRIKDQENSHLQDVFFDSAKSTINLKKKTPFIEFHFGNAIVLFKKYEKKFFIALAVFFGVAIFSSFYVSTANVAIFYSTKCLGGWEHPENAEGKPTLALSADPEDFTKNNSAYVKEHSATMYCGEFDGAIPVDAVPKNFKLSLSWSVDNGTIRHREPKPFDLPSDLLPGDDSIIELPSDPVDTILQDIDQEGKTETSPAEMGEDSESVAPQRETDTPSEQSPEKDKSESDIETSTDEQTWLESIFGKKVFAQEESTSSHDSSETSSSDNSASEDSDASSDALTTDEVSQDSSNENDVSDLKTDSSQIPVNEIRESNVSRPESVPKTINKKNRIKKSPSLAPAEPVIDGFMEVSYTLNGTEWTSLGQVSMDNWNETSFEIPLTDWTDLSTFQVGFQTLPNLNISPAIYIDSVSVEVEYEGNVDDTMPDFDSGIVRYDKTFDTIRVIKIENNLGITQLWYADAKETVLVPETLKPNPDEEDSDTETLIPSLQTPPHSSIEIIEIIDEPSTLGGGDGGQAETPESENEEPVPVGETPIENGKEVPVTNENSDVSEEETPEEDTSTVVFGTEVTAPPLPLLALIEEGQGILDLISEETDISQPVFEVSKEIRLALVAPIPVVTPLDESQKKIAKTLIWHFVAEGNVVDAQSQALYENGFLYWLDDTGTFIYRLDIAEQSMLSDYFDPNRTIVDLKELDKKETFENGALHTCRVIPFSQKVTSLGGHANLILSQHVQGIQYDLDTGGLPEGLHIIFHPGTQEGAIATVPITIEASPEMIEGSYTIVILATEAYNHTMLTNYCQFNVVVEE